MAKKTTVDGVEVETPEEQGGPATAPLTPPAATEYEVLFTAIGDRNGNLRRQGERVAAADIRAEEVPRLVEIGAIAAR
ncbi:MAG: hypothetical protein E6Q97_19930 [Desulfurellales bacterium]|nr:MAG: hypothetical protein E6Q97_19930 [Desulfurellales bacterium]